MFGVDEFSNDGNTVSAVTDGSAVTIDLTAPTLPTVSIASDNALDTTKANVGDTITVSMTASEAIVTPKVVIKGKAATVSGSGTSFTAAYTVAAGAVSEGLVYVLVEFEDLASNEGKDVLSVTDASTVTVDLTAPTMSTLTISSSNAADSTKANAVDATTAAADTITVAVTFSEAIAKPAILIAGQPAVVKGSGATWTGAYTVVAADVVEGPVSVNVGFQDLASNNGTNATAVTDRSAVEIDLTPPTLTAVTIVSDNAADSSRANAADVIAVSIVASETITTPVVLIAGQSAGVSFSSGSWRATYTVVSNQVTEGNATISIVYKDLSSNGGQTVTSVTDSSVVTIDLTPPTLTAVSIVSDNVADTARANAGDTVTLTFTPSEPITTPEYSV